MSYGDEYFQAAPDDDEDENLSASNPMKQLRNHAKKLERELRKRDKELEQLRAWKEQREGEDRRREVIGRLEQLGFNAKHVELFMAAKPNEEPTSDNVRAFAKEYGLVPDEQPVEEATEQTSEGESEGFSPAAPVGSPAGPNAKVYSREEFKKLHAENQAEAMKVLREGRVELANSLSS